MQRKPLAFCAALLTAVGAVISFAALTHAQTLPPAPGSTAGAGDWLRRGQVLEGERRWGEALTYYEEALRQFPADGDLKRRFDSARLHYDLGRRYNDRSYRDGLARMSFQDTLDLYNEVLLKVQAHYVDGPKWKQWVANAEGGLEVAMSEPTFLQANSARVCGAGPGKAPRGASPGARLADHRVAERCLRRGGHAGRSGPRSPGD